MLERGRAAGIALAVTDVLPWNNGDARAAADIERLNALIRQLDAGALLPFHDTLADPADPTRMGDGLTDDGDHPSVEGHRLLGERAFRLDVELEPVVGALDAVGQRELVRPVDDHEPLCAGRPEGVERLVRR